MRSGEMGRQDASPTTVLCEENKEVSDDGEKKAKLRLDRVVDPDGSGTGGLETGHGAIEVLDGASRLVEGGHHSG